MQLLTCLQTARLPEAQGISAILSSRIVTRSMKPSLTVARHRGAHRKPSSISLPLYSASIRVESLWFTPSFILLQMYPPDIQHTSTDNSEQKGALVFKDLVRQTLISVAHLFGSFARVPLEGQGRTSQGRTFSCL